ncbi:hypothetical protein LJB42_001696 [Komagataella kurtzmanii]|nr:hypothetical protein LJB42_001696 [Komagataella kurtzmanii]
MSSDSNSESDCLTLDNPNPSYGSVLRRLSNASTKSVWSKIERGRRLQQRMRFWHYCLFGAFVIIVFNLIFLPRTSLSRDLRRLHGDGLTDSDLKRIYLNELASPDSLEWLYEEDLTRNMREKFEEYGLKTSLSEYYVTLNEPKKVSVSLILDQNVVYTPELEGDEGRVAFHAFSANGTATGPLVFANHGTFEDFETLRGELEEALKGSIVLIKYSDLILPSLQVEIAEKFGVAGVLLFNDPADDHIDGKPFPSGPARNPQSTQRDTVNNIANSPGDPATPGWASKKHSRKLGNQQIPSVPSIPISFEAAKPMLDTLNGKKITKFPYPLNSTKHTVVLENIQEYKPKIITNVVGTIPGILGTEEIIVGSHRDSWTKFGEGDPISGTKTMLSMIQGFSKLLDLGYKPLRNIKFVSWDASKYGLIGSTEYAEDHQRYIKKNTLCYFNLDTAISGSTFYVGSHPMLKNLVIDASRTVLSPSSIKEEDYLYDYWLKQDNITVETLGSGGDFNVFQNHLGVPSVQIGFVNGPGDAVFHKHSSFDNKVWMEKYGDPEGKKLDTISKFIGMLTLMLSESEVAHFNVDTYSSLTTDLYNNLINCKTINKWKNYYILEQEHPASKKVWKQLNSGQVSEIKFVHLLDLVKSNFLKWNSASVIFHKYMKDLQEEIVEDYPWFKYYKKIKIAVQIKLANLKLVSLDSHMLIDEGLPKRHWMKHTILGSDRLTGQATLFPGLSEAIDEVNYEETVKWLMILSDKLESITCALSR